MPFITIIIWINRFMGCIYVINYFLNAMPVAETELNYTNPYELLVAVILSAQCTDKRVNMITPKLFEEFPTPEIMSEASVDNIFEIVFFLISLKFLADNPSKILYLS